MQSDMLDVVIGVVFVWFLLSGLISVVNEAFSLATHARAKHLWLGIGRLVDPEHSPLPRRLWDVTFRLPFRGDLDLRPKTPATTGSSGGPMARGWQAWTGKMTDRPQRKDGSSNRRRDLRSQLQTIYEAAAPQLVEVAKPGRLSKLSRVPAAAVADAVTRFVRPVHRAELLDAAGHLRWPDDRQDALRTLLADVDETAAIELDDLLALAQRRRTEPSEADAAPPDAGQPETGQPGAALAEAELAEAAFTEAELAALHDEASVRLGLADLTGRLQDTNSDLAKALRRAMAGVAADQRVAAVRKVIEQRFDHEMAQLTVFYRRQARKVMALLALPVVVLFHADAIALVQDLHDDTVLRQAVVNEAITAGAADSLDDAVRQGCTSTTTRADPDPVVAATDQLACARRIVDDAAPLRVGLAIDELEAAHGDPERYEKADIVPYLWDDGWGLVGRGLTLVALLFGAQFWFDVLRRLVGVRRPAPASPAPADA